MIFFFLLYPDHKTVTLFLVPEQMIYVCILDENLYIINK